VREWVTLPSTSVSPFLFLSLVSLVSSAWPRQTEDRSGGGSEHKDDNGEHADARGRVASRGPSMAVNPRDMDGFMPLLSTTDIKKKLNVGNALLNYLGDSSKSIECQDIGMFIDNVIPWLGNGNPKVRTLREASSRPSEVSFESLRTRLTYTCLYLPDYVGLFIANESCLRFHLACTCFPVLIERRNWYGKRWFSRYLDRLDLICFMYTRARARIHTSARA